MSTETETKPASEGIVTTTEKIMPDDEKKKDLSDEGTGAEVTTPLVAKEEKDGGKDKDKEEKATKEKSPPPPPPPRVHKVDYQKDVVYLYQFCRTPVLPSLSPYCLKVETWLRLTGLKYENVDHRMKFKSSKGQLPFVELNGEEIADSAVIISKLSQQFGVDPDAQLTKEEKNSSHALISMIENHLCWVYVYWRSKNPDSMIKGSKLSLQHALGSRLPKFFLNFFFKMTYGRSGARKVKAHGLGVHSPEEILDFGKKDLSVLEETLGDKDYYFGDKPSNLDVVAFSHLAQIAYVDKSVDYELRDWMTDNCPRLLAMMNRLKERCFPDWDEMGTTLGLNTHIPPPPPEEKKEDEKESKEPAEKEPIKEETKDEKKEEAKDKDKEEEKK